LLDFAARIKAKILPKKTKGLKSPVFCDKWCLKDDKFGYICDESATGFARFRKKLPPPVTIYIQAAGA
jgi:hypothetical protein